MKQNIFITDDWKTSIRWDRVGVTQFSLDTRDDQEVDAPVPGFRADSVVLFGNDAMKAYEAFLEFHGKGPAQ